MLNYIRKSNKPQRTNVERYSEYHNLKLGIQSYPKIFREDCVEWFINEMLKMETYMKNYFKNSDREKIPKQN